MASILSAAVSALLEFDEVSVQLLDEDTVEYKILTTGILPKLCDLKMLIWSYLAPPVKRLEIVEVREVERGPAGVAKRYLITARGTRRFRGITPRRR